ncbi:hypothetical protein SCUP234_11884, partial [Seiridium cupressi]
DVLVQRKCKDLVGWVTKSWARLYKTYETTRKKTAEITKSGSSITPRGSTEATKLMGGEKVIVQDWTTTVWRWEFDGNIQRTDVNLTTGKTLTAERVAEITEKPLYPVTCGDVGTKAEAVETYLESVFHLGKLWGCIVLLDEADAFLEQSSLENQDRTALVPVFLRVLEYYEGILILTSNRVGIFDEAFKSRIQLEKIDDECRFGGPPG